MMKYTRKAVYTGLRYDMFSNQILQRFELLPDKKEIFFSKIKGVYVGYTYHCQATKMPRRPERTDDEHIVNAAWEGADAAAREARLKRLEKKKAENKIAKIAQSKINEVVELIIPLIKDIEMPSDERALIEHLWRLAKNKKRGFKK